MVSASALGWDTDLKDKCFMLFVAVPGNFASATFAARSLFIAHCYLLISSYHSL